MRHECEQGEVLVVRPRGRWTGDLDNSWAEENSSPLPHVRVGTFLCPIRIIGALCARGTVLYTKWSGCLGGSWHNILTLVVVSDIQIPESRRHPGPATLSATKHPYFALVQHHRVCQSWQRDVCHGKSWARPTTNGDVEHVYAVMVLKDCPTSRTRPLHHL